MAKKQDKIWIMGGIAIVAFILLKGNFLNIGQQALLDTDAIDRQVPASVISQGDTFQINYVFEGSSGNQWGASITDEIVGGCTFPSGSSDYSSVMLYEDGIAKTITLTAPSTKATCVFSGDYLLSDETGNKPVKTILDFFSGSPTSVVEICTSAWSCSSWGTCGGICDWTDKDLCLESYDESGSQTRTCTDSQSCGLLCDNPSVCGESESCTTQCTRTVTKNTIAPDQDTNCDGSIDRIELGGAITGWINTQISRDDLGAAIQAWVGGV